jgi:DNA-binding GntR family transcriptional regulator
VEKLAVPTFLGVYTALDTAPTRRGNDAYLQLKSQLLRGDFALNVRLSETRLAAALGLSRTPVREAIQRLAAESLIEPHAEGGFQPSVPDTKVMRELYEIRAGLELQALQRPARHGTRHDPAIIEPLRDRWRAMREGELPAPDPDFVLLDESFHVTLMSASGNRAATELLRQVNERIRIVRMHDFLIPERIDATITEHLGIAELVLAGDVLAAEGAFTAHLAVSLAVVEERSGQAIARMARGTRR